MESFLTKGVAAAAGGRTETTWIAEGEGEEARLENMTMRDGEAGEPQATARAV